MNNRKSLQCISLDRRQVEEGLVIPPLIKRDDAVLIGINLRKELIKLRAWDKDASTFERIIQLLLRQVVVVILINTFE